MNQLIFILTFVILAFCSCEKEELTVAETTPYQLAKAGGDCVLNDHFIPAKIINFCGVDLVFQASLQLLNNGNFHWIQSEVRCYKLGGDPGEVVDFAKLEVSIDGTMSIGCGQTFQVQEASVYNANLVNGEVPSFSDCQNCGITLARIEYKKDVTLKDDELLKASCRLELEGCGDNLVEFITVVLEP